MPEHDPVYKVSIIPRGRALGVTMFLPEEDRYSHSKRYLISSICSLFGGRIAEELTLGVDGVTTGASNDIERATSLARNMVTRWGLSEKLGPLQYDTDSEEPFLGRSAGQVHTVYSPETAQRIDEEVRNIIDECYAKAKQILIENRDKLDMMAEALMKYETIDRYQIDDIMEGREPRPPAGWGDSNPTGGVRAEEPEAAKAKGSDSGRQPGVGRPAGEH
jgi:cell division protease FtsH